MRTLLLSLLLAASAFGQTPDCNITATLNTSTTTSTAFNNKVTRCALWYVSYYTGNATGVSLTLQGAPDVSGAPGAYTALTATQGTTNPATGTAEGQIVASPDYYPWIRVNAGTFTGTNRTMSVTIYGWKAPPSNPSQSGGGVASNVNVAQYGGVATSLGQKAMAASVPVVVASDQSTIPVSISGNQNVNLAQVGGTAVVNGGLAGSQGVGGLAAVGAALVGSPVVGGWRDTAGVIVPEYCTSRFAFTNPGTGSTQLVAVSGTTTIRICEFFFTGDTLTTLQLVTGTGSTCTSPTAETGVMSGPGGGVFGVALDFNFGALVTTSTKTLCLSLSAASTGGGYITYSQR